MMLWIVYQSIFSCLHTQWKYCILSENILHTIGFMIMTIYKVWAQTIARGQFSNGRTIFWTCAWLKHCTWCWTHLSGVATKEQHSFGDVYESFTQYSSLSASDIREYQRNTSLIDTAYRKCCLSAVTLFIRQSFWLVKHCIWLLSFQL